MSDELPVTRLLNLAAGGDAAARENVLPLIYEELKRIARARRSRSSSGDTLRTTALVHEAYLRLVDRQGLAFEGRQQFYGLVALAMRDLLVEEARRRSRQKRGGGQERVDLEEIGCSVESSPDEILALDDALVKLRDEDAEDAEIVMLRYFAGLTVQEIADLRQVSSRTIERRWRFCRAWLQRELAAAD